MLFLGPQPSVIDALGDKIKAKTLGASSPPTSQYTYSS